MRSKANSQQNIDAVSARHWFIMDAFWNSDLGVQEVDGQRTFSHAQRVAIFLRDDRMCLRQDLRRQVVVQRPLNGASETACRRFERCSIEFFGAEGCYDVR